MDVLLPKSTLLWVLVVKCDVTSGDGNVGVHVKSGAKSCCLEILQIDHGDANLRSEFGIFFSKKSERWEIEQDIFTEVVSLWHDVSLISYLWKVNEQLSLPTRFNVSRRGIDIDSIMCTICDNGVKTSRHLFFYCCMVRQNDSLRSLSMVEMLMEHGINVMRRLV
ncbi:RNA-directed DNA polymerase, eukaryota, partial [Tanacetum coccineum]